MWFTKNNAKEAMDFYVSVFPNSEIVSINYYPDESTNEHLSNMQGKVLTGVAKLNGQEFLFIDGGEQGFDFNESISFMISCKDQEEIDYYWSKLSAVSESEQCGWCKDKYGLSWQIVPENLGKLMTGPKSQENLMKMKKIIIADL